MSLTVFSIYNNISKYMLEYEKAITIEEIR